MNVNPIVLVLAMLIDGQHTVTVQALPAGMCKDMAAHAIATRDPRVQGAACMRDDDRLARALEAAGCEAFSADESQTVFLCERAPAWKR